VGNQHTNFLERAFVHQKVQTLARGKLSFFMLTFNSGRAAAGQSLIAFMFKDFYFVLHWDIIFV